MTKSIDDLIREAVNARAAAAPSASCLDAETAAAFVEDALPAAERTGAEAHVADCARCQALLAALARTAPPVDARAWWRRPAIAWLVPAAVAAAAVLILLNVPQRTAVTPAVQPAAEDTFAAKADSSSTGREPASSERPSEPMRDSAAVQSPRPALPPSERRRAAAGRSEAVAAGERSYAANSGVDVPMAAPQTSAAGAAPAAAVPELPSASVPASDALNAPPVASESLRQRRESEPQHSIAETVTLAAEAAAPRLAQTVDLSRTVIVSSDSIGRWRIGTAGTVQHSVDGGATWQARPLGVNVTPTAGSSPSRSICWLVGRGGLVLMTTDEGRSWQRVPFPAAADLVSIRAADDKTATVVTSDRRTFTTSDGGRTWRR